MFDCPQCGAESEELSEGCCEECRKENQARLDEHNYRFDEWESLTLDQREARIKAALR